MEGGYRMIQTTINDDNISVNYMGMNKLVNFDEVGKVLSFGFTNVIYNGAIKVPQFQQHIADSIKLDGSIEHHYLKHGDKMHYLMAVYD